jgi:IS5 family transposase
MHDLYSIYVKVRKSVKEALKQYLVSGQNLAIYPNPPKMCDLDIISLSVTAEALGIDSENFLWSKLKKDYADRFPDLIHRTRYNARRKSLRDWMVVCSDIWSEQISVGETTFIVDSIPIPICKMSREKSVRICRKSCDEYKASKGWSATERNYFIGYKLHLITSSTGVFQEYALWPANVHDIHFLKQMKETHLLKCELLGDRAYRSAPLQMNLFEAHEIELTVPYRRNQHDYTPYSEDLKIKRKRIETVFSQYCDEFMLKRNYAKSYSGIETRIVSKITSMTFKQYWNYLNGNKISKTKHALAA